MGKKKETGGEGEEGGTRIEVDKEMHREHTHTHTHSMQGEVGKWFEKVRREREVMCALARACV